MEWLLFTWIFLFVSIGTTAGLIFYKKNKELNKKFRELEQQKPVVFERWLSRR